MPIQTGGFGVQVMPQMPAIDPALYAIDPGQISNGVLQAFNVANTYDKLKAFKAQQAEQDATRADRLAQIHAISQLDVLKTGEATATSGARVGNDLANFATSTAKSRGELADLPSVRASAERGRALANAKADVEEPNLGTDKNLEQDLKRAQAEYYRAESEWRKAEAIKNQAVAGATPKDDAVKAWEKSIGEMAAATGLSPTQTRQLFDSKLKNKDGVPLSTELAAIAENVKKPNFFLNPYDKMSPELAHWLGNDGVQALQNYGASLAKQEGDKADGVAKPASAKSEASTPNVIKVDTKGNIIREKPAATPEQPAAAPAQATDTGTASKAGGILRDFATMAPALMQGGVSSGLSADTLLKARAAARLVGSKLGQVGPMAGRAAGAVARVAGRAYLPIAAMDIGNRRIGEALSDKDTGQMTAFEGMAAAATSPSFDQQQQDAKYDEISQRIKMTISSRSLTEDQKDQELAKLLNQRDILWSIMNQGQGPGMIADTGQDFSNKMFR